MIYKRQRLDGFLNRSLFFIGEGEHAQRPGVVLYISLLANNQGWLFEWPSTGDDYYRVVLRGRQIGTVVDETHGMQSYIYSGSGFILYPPPLEILPSSAGLAVSEINKPFLVIQWYPAVDAAYYQVQEYVSGNWTTVFQIDEIDASVYTWTSPILVDETTHLYRVLAFNNLQQSGTALGFDVSPIVTPPSFVEPLYSVTYDNTGHNIVLDLV